MAKNYVLVVLATMLSFGSMAIGPITGSTSVCATDSTLLGDITPGGVWLSGNAAIATVSTAGMVTGVGTGVTTIYYIAAGDTAASSMTVQVMPSILGISTVCVSSSIYLTGHPAGGAWSVGNTAIATFGLPGVTGVSAGETNVNYTIGGCSAVNNVTVTPFPSITGDSAVCTGATIALTGSPAGGTWSDGGRLIATASPTTGVVTGVYPGNINIYYIVNGCYTYNTITVNSTPVLVGNNTVCSGSSITITSSPAGGTWSSGNTAIAMVGATGVTTGESAGIATISYSDNGCSAIHNITVNAMPTAISGSNTVCAGDTVILSESVTGGSWISGNNSIATVSLSGVVTGTGTGIVNIYYSMGSGTTSCVASHAITVNASPTISGVTSICAGATADLTGYPTGGAWNSGNAGIATVSIAGVVSGLTGGATSIYYTRNGCAASHTLSVNPIPAISGDSVMCAGATIAFTGAPAGGTWSDGGSAFVSLNAATGIATGTAAGSAYIYYTVGGCNARQHVTVNAMPAISGGTSVCASTALSLTSAPSGGVWTSGNTALATVTTSGVFTGTSAGTDTIYYSINGCMTTHTVTVNASPGAISGSASLCAGAATTLTESTTGGYWISSNTSIAAINSSGTLTASGTGSVIIYYSMTPVVSGCAASYLVSVGAVPTINGVAVVCAGQTTDLDGSPTGGTWSTGLSGIATVNASGIVTGLSSGIVSVSYTKNGCTSSYPVTVNAFPSISGDSIVCTGATIGLPGTPSGGTWSDGGRAFATVGPSTGVVTGVAPGIINIYYIITGCNIYKAITVNLAPAITGSSSVCGGSSVTLEASPAGGVWSTGNGAVATVNTAGMVTGLTGGVTTIIYSTGGCTASHTFTVNATPGAISGPGAVCQSATITLTDAISGGAWISGNTDIATVGSTGVVGGSGSGVVNIYYSTGTTSGGCIASHVVTVGATPYTTGATSMCSGTTISLSGAPSGGTWSSGNTAVAIVGSTGIVSGVSGGVAGISYTTATGCSAYHTVTVNASPSISGDSTICTGSTITLTSATTSGTWGSDNNTIAAVSASGVVTGNTAGVTSIYYLNSSCYAYRTVTVGATPAGISGGTTLCTGATMTLTDGVRGGTWVSGNSTVATVNSSGAVTGLNAGVLNVYYTTSGSLSGCVVYQTITVNASPSVSGPASVCGGSVIDLAGAPTGGSWSSASAAIASVGSTGVVTGGSVGVANISYLQGGCYASQYVTVSATPAISGASTVCNGRSITLGATPAGGLWSSENTAVAIIGSTGTVTGESAGVVIIDYTTAGGCAAQYSVTVSAMPSSITGSGSVCAGATVTLSEAISGGTWISGNVSVATVNSSGVVTGVAPGALDIYYTTSGTSLSSCATYYAVTVNASPSVAGAATVCSGATTTLTGTPTGGSWNSANTAVAAISITGVLTGETAGADTISYALNGCYAHYVVTINTMPAISGASSVCAGATDTLTGTPSGGTWSDGGATIATVNASGMVFAISSGIVSIYYTYSSCYISQHITLNATPAVSGATAICSGYTATLSGLPVGGAWSSGNTGIAIAGTTGIVTGESAGTTGIYYSLNGCSSYHNITVNASPSAISGPSAACSGTTIALVEGATGGTWISGNTSLATVGSSGTVNAIGAGVVNIYYSASGSLSGCVVAYPITINPTPAISGASSIFCTSATIDLMASPAGGSWSGGTSGIATVSSTGVVTGISAGTTVVTYSYGACAASHSVTITAFPAISGDSSVCTGSTIALTGTPAGGYWSDGGYPFATVGAATGIVTGTAPGAEKIYYITGSCFAYQYVTVNLTPAISGDSVVCTGSTVNLECSPSGGSWSTANSGIVTASATGVSTGAAVGIAAGTASISYYAGGCSTYQHFTVNQTPAISGDSTVCASLTITMTATPAGGTWTGGGAGIFDLVSAGVIMGTEGGIANVYYTVTGCTAYQPVTVDVSTATITGAGIVAMDDSISLSTSGSGGAWYSANAALATVSGSGEVYGVTLGTVNVYYSVPGECPAYQAISISPNSTRHNNNITANSGISVYPNPARSSINIAWPQSADGNASVTITDMAGHMIYETSIDAGGQNQSQIGIASLSNGLYIITIQCGSYGYTGKLSVQN